MLNLFDKNRSISISISANEKECVLIAAKDLQKDLRRLSGQENAFPITDDLGAPCIQIITVPEGQIAGVNIPGKYEGYAVSVDQSGIVIAGCDSLGTIYGIYSFCENILGINPTYLFTGLFPPVKEILTVENTVFSDCPRGARLRGWFINDEDLLTDFRSGGGKRNIEYRFYQNVIHPSVIEMLLETALRLKLNLIIPSSFIDIDNPDEEKLVSAVCRRGMYITQHHVEPMGVSYYSALNYMKRQGIDGQISFVQNRSFMEEIWRYYAEKWAVYGKQVVWQLGLRGRGDNPIWVTDKNVPDLDKQRGKIISDAIETQYNILKQVTNNSDFYSTMTLWMEGSNLYEKGLLIIPKSTVVIFCDIGFNQMFSADFYSVTRKPECKYGVYYHVAHWTHGPHMAEGCCPEKMTFSYYQAQKYNSLYYSILNVTNLREVHFSVWLNAVLVWSPDDFCLQTSIKNILHDIYGNCAEKVEEGYRRYYGAFVDLGTEELKIICDKAHYNYCEYGQLPFINHAANDGCIKDYGLSALILDFANMPSDEIIGKFIESEKKFAALLDYWKEIEWEIPKHCLEYYRIFPVLQTNYLLLLTRWLIGCMEFAAAMSQNHTEAAEQNAKKAASYLQKIIFSRRIAQQGKWQGWYTGEKKMNIKSMLDDTLQASSNPESIRIKQLNYFRKTV